MEAPPIGLVTNNNALTYKVPTSDQRTCFPCAGGGWAYRRRYEQDADATSGISPQAASAFHQTQRVDGSGAHRIVPTCCSFPDLRGHRENPPSFQIARYFCQPAKFIGASKHFGLVYFESTKEQLVPYRLCRADDLWSGFATPRDARIT
jgi:hypothetical protein